MCYWVTYKNKQKSSIINLYWEVKLINENFLNLNFKKMSFLT